MEMHIFWFNTYNIAIIFILFIYTPIVTDAIFQDDRELLKSLKDYFITRRTAIPSWFDSDIYPCNWTGIKCHEDIVTNIDLSKVLSPLELPFPVLIGEFRSLKHLNLSHCAFTGLIPLNLWNLQSLEIMDLSYNRLNGTLSSSVSGLINLKLLVLDHNTFYGGLPTTIGKLEKLEELSVSGNLFSGNLPKEMVDLKNLHSLDISENLFSGSLGNLTRLMYLDAHQNKLSGQIISEIGNMTMLILLDLSQNSINGMMPKTIANLKQLQSLKLKDCGITGPIPEEISELRSLQFLNIAGNNFQGSLPTGVGNLENLVHLIGRNTALSGGIPPELGRCKRLKIIDLSMNSLLGPLPYDLVGMQSVKSVLLDSNRLSGLVPNWINNWTQVETITLSRNQFSGSLPVLNLNFLSSIDLSWNELSGEIPNHICNAKSLRIIHLAHNNFSGSIQESFCNCSNLKDLVLIGNDLSGEVPAYLGDLKLVTLELTNNKFSGKIPDQLWESKTLMEISVSINYLDGSIPDAIGKVSTLKRLQLDNNRFNGTIPTSLGKLGNLTDLSLHGNELTGRIPTEIFECTKLVSMDMGSNRLTGPIPESVSQLKLLENLVLSNNNLSGSIPDDICSCFQDEPLPESLYLQYYGRLDLSNNALEGPIPESINKCSVLTELLLQGNRLNGSIPYGISTLDQLASLDLSYNSLTGFIVPQLFLMKNIGGIILSHNHISGIIPDFKNSSLPLAKLDLSYNLLTGSVPRSVFNLKYLTYLDICSNSLSGSLYIESNASKSLVLLNASNNHFSGALSDDSLQSLTSLFVLDIHNNKLTGSLPSSLSAFTSLTYLDISNNDFRNTFPCNICDLQGLNFVNFSDNSFTGFVPYSCDKVVPCRTYQDVGHSWRISRVSIYAIVVGAIIISVAVILGILKWRKLRHDKLVTQNEHACSDDQILLKKQKEPLSINIAMFEHSLRRVTASDILSATENFSRSHVIGEGGFGTVYKALLPGQILAVKRLNKGNFHGDREFSAEMETIGKVNHENLVPLLGYCVYSDEKFLIYKYMENGSLDFWLYNQTDSMVPPLDWHTRFKICLGSAQGLAFLHHGFVPHIIHRDIKSSNILLDKNFEARVSDFGLARIISSCETHVSTLIAGTCGYIPPEYGQTMMATIKGDVYSFGVVMLELITGKPPLGQPDVEGGNLVGWVRWMIGNKRECQMLDPHLSDLLKWKDHMLYVLNIAVKCTRDDPWKRPTMLEVVKELKQGNFIVESPCYAGEISGLDENQDQQSVTLISGSQSKEVSSPVLDISISVSQISHVELGIQTLNQLTTPSSSEQPKFLPLFKDDDHVGEKMECLRQENLRTDKECSSITLPNCGQAQAGSSEAHTLPIVHLDDPRYDDDAEVFVDEAEASSDDIHEDEAPEDPLRLVKIKGFNVSSSSEPRRSNFP